MQQQFSTVVLFALLAVGASGLLTKSSSDDSLRKNPIRKVVNLLEKMGNKLEEEGKKEKELYDNYVCYCKNNDADLNKAIADAEAKIPEVEADIKEESAQKAAMQEELKQHKADRVAAKEAIAKANQIREKELSDYKTETGEQKADIDAMGQAIAAIEKGTKSSFLQSNAAQVLRKLAVVKVDMLDADRDDLVSFLSSASSTNYAPQSGQITGILKTMKETLEKELASAEQNEADAVKDHNQLIQAKNTELTSLNTAIQQKSERLGELSTEIAMLMRDKIETQKELNDNREFLTELTKDCAKKADEYEERNKVRSQESIAIAETIKILNDDDALDLFKKTLHRKQTSFLQVDSSAASRKKHALEIIRAAQQNPRTKGDTKLDLLALSMHGDKFSFDKVFAIIDGMIQELRDEGTADDDHKHRCELNFDKSADQKKVFAQGIDDSQTAVDKEEDDIAEVVEQIKDIKDKIVKLNKVVAEAQVQREAEHKEFADLVAENGQAIDLLKFAKNRLYKFYNPDLYIEPEGEANKEGEAAAFIQVKQTRADPGDRPESWGPSYEKKSTESSSVLQLIDGLVADLKTENTEATAGEKDAQGDYESLVKHSNDKVAVLGERLTDKQQVKAGMEDDLESHKDELKSNKQEFANTEEYIKNLHKECDWLLAHYQERKDTRLAEIDQMNLAKGALKGAVYQE